MEAMGLGTDPHEVGTSRDGPMHRGIRPRGGGLHFNPSNAMSSGSVFADDDAGGNDQTEAGRKKGQRLADVRPMLALTQQNIGLIPVLGTRHGDMILIVGSVQHVSLPGRLGDFFVLRWQYMDSKQEHQIAPSLRGDASTRSNAMRTSDDHRSEISSGRPNSATDSPQQNASHRQTHHFGQHRNHHQEHDPSHLEQSLPRQFSEHSHRDAFFTGAANKQASEQPRTHHRVKPYGSDSSMPVHEQKQAPGDEKKPSPIRPKLEPLASRPSSGVGSNSMSSPDSSIRAISSRPLPGLVDKVEAEQAADTRPALTGEFDEGTPAERKQTPSDGNSDADGEPKLGDRSDTNKSSDNGDEDENESDNDTDEELLKSLNRDEPKDNQDAKLDGAERRKLNPIEIAPDSPEPDLTDSLPKEAPPPSEG